MVKALARAVMRFVQAGEAANWGGPLEDKMEGKFTVVWTIDGETTSSSSGVLLDSQPSESKCVRFEALQIEAPQSDRMQN